VNLGLRGRIFFALRKPCGGEVGLLQPRSTRAPAIHRPAATSTNVTANQASIAPPPLPEPLPDMVGGGVGGGGRESGLR